MAHSIPDLFKDGQAYMQVWPLQKELYTVFPECRVVSATKFSIRYMPPLAILVGASQVLHFGAESIPQAIALAAFFLSLPMQGLLWLGHRSNQPLPPAMASWYQEIYQKMREQGCQVQELKSRPRYKELAKLLRTAFDELDKVFTKNWF